MKKEDKAMKNVSIDTLTFLKYLCLYLEQYTSRSYQITEEDVMKPFSLGERKRFSISDKAENYPILEVLSKVYAPVTPYTYNHIFKESPIYLSEDKEKKITWETFVREFNWNFLEEFLGLPQIFLYAFYEELQHSTNESTEEICKRLLIKLKPEKI